MNHTLPDLPYAKNALEPFIDALTMEIHHDRHHQTYVNNLNAALESAPALAKIPGEQLISDLNAVPEAIRTAVRNNAGGHVNHSFFWRIMAPHAGDGIPTGDLASAIKRKFGSFEQFKSEFTQAATKRFGSGWAWLVLDQAGELKVCSTPNQDNPIMQGEIPLLGLDVWEHAYYLKYQNKRPDYINAFWNVVNWNAVSKHYEAAKKKVKLNGINIFN